MRPPTEPAAPGRRTDLADVPDAADLRAVADRSAELIAGLQDPGGAYPASPTFSAYRGYAWLRDGAFTAEGMSRYGALDSVDRFHDWVVGVLRQRRQQVHLLVNRNRAGAAPTLDEMLPTRFTFSGENGSDPWWDFQTDGYGTWLWAVTEHSRRHGRDLGRWRSGIEVAVDYLTVFWDRACYDWWEEHVEQRHVSTLAAIHGGLRAAAESGVLDTERALTAYEVAEAARDLVLRDGVVDGHLTKWLGTDAVDGSLPSCIVPFGLLDAGDPRAGATLDAVARDLDSGGGVHRFADDVFYGGGQWLLLSCLLGWNRAVRGETDEALRLLRWVAAQATPDGELPEQVANHLLHPTHREEWLRRWGPVATPLLWSHGMYLILADELRLLAPSGERTVP
jgi:GH15 family glucan-1,4-alpha-glucosidase